MGQCQRPDLGGGVQLFGRATVAGEPVEVVVTGGLVQVSHADVLVATHAQRLRPDQADRALQLPRQCRACDAAAGLTVIRLADNNGAVSFAGATYRIGRAWRGSASRSASWPGRCSWPKTAL